MKLRLKETDFKLIAMNTCRICKSQKDHPLYHPKEVLLGSKEVFEYFKCQQCGCLQISTIPTDLSKYYPQHYPSFKNYTRLVKNTLRNTLDKKRVEHSLNRPNLIGWLGKFLARPLNYVDWMRTAGCKADDNILDIGCGNGQLLLRMKIGGIDTCEGIDPFVTEEISYPNGLKIHKKTIMKFAETSNKKYKLIMLNHSLEHMTDMHEVIEAVAKILHADGVILIRIPVIDSLAWDRYQENWFNLDAPRHIYLMNEKSLGTLLQAFGLDIFKIEYESHPTQFVWSEMCHRGYTKGDKVKPLDILGKDKIHEFTQLAAKVKIEKRSDCAAFFARFKPTVNQ